MQSNTLDPIIIVAENRLRAIVRESVETAVTSALVTHLADLQMRLEWLSNSEAMRELGMSRSTLARLRKSGKLRYSKQGSMVLYRRTDIEQMLEAGLRSHS